MGCSTTRWSAKSRDVATLVVLFCLSWVAAQNSEQLIGPTFNGPIQNITVPVGRDAILTCVVDNLSIYKVAWLRVDTQTILTIHVHVITKNNRIGVTHSEQKTWHLHIRNVRESDRGWYMCQINTDPMKSQIGFLDVVVPPDILDSSTSTDLTVRENYNVTFQCHAKGSPVPTITWKREDGKPIFFNNGTAVLKIQGNEFQIERVNRVQMGPYLCIATNGIPPTVSKRIILNVHFPPMVSLSDHFIEAYMGQNLTIECHIESYPESHSYWTKDDGAVLIPGNKYITEERQYGYKKILRLIIINIDLSDNNTYKCVSRNLLGRSDDNINVRVLVVITTSATTLLSTLQENVILVERKWTPSVIKFVPDVNNTLKNSLEIDMDDVKTTNDGRTFDTRALSSTCAKNIVNILILLFSTFFKAFV